MPRIRAHNQPVAFRTGRAPRVPAPVKTGPTRAQTHQSDALTLLSAVDSATTGELAHCLELSAPYLAQLLELLELEGRIESGKDGRHKTWRLA
jgi:hypothetical protein